jgi:hypothetical protein
MAGSQYSRYFRYIGSERFGKKFSRRQMRSCGRLLLLVALRISLCVHELLFNVNSAEADMRLQWLP